MRMALLMLNEHLQVEYSSVGLLRNDVNNEVFYRNDLIYLIVQTQADPQSRGIPVLPPQVSATAVATNVCGSCCVVLGETHMIDRLHILHPTDGLRYMRRTWRMDAFSPPPVTVFFDT